MKRRQVKMKKNVNLISALAILIFCLSATQASALFMDFTVSDNFIKPGETFKIEVWANNVFDAFPSDEVLAFGFDVANSYPSIIRFDSATVGPLFNDDSAFFANTDVAGSAFPGILDDSILLATLNCTALSLGSSQLGIASDVTDFNEGLSYFNAGNVDITSSKNINVVPEPSTCLLVCSGLAGLVFLRNRKVRV